MSAEPVLSPPRETSPPAGAGTARQGVGRLVGVDLARALAVFGMYAVHVGPPSVAVSGPGGWLIGLSEGRASALFAVLAGFSVMLIAGRRQPKTGVDGRRARARILLRSAVLLVAGTALTLVAGDVVILAYYAVFFVMTLPLLRLSGRALALLAAALAVITPLLALGLQTLLTPAVQQAVNTVDPLERISGVGVLDLLVTGFYPAVTWITFVVAGMALARFDLSAPAVQRRIAGLGALLTAVAYGVPQVVAHLVGGTLLQMAQAPTGRNAEALEGSGAAMGAAKGAFDAAADGAAGAMSGGGPGGDAWSLLLAQPHTGSTFDLVGSTGVAMLVLVGSIVLVESFARVRWLLTPVIAVGTMSLTVYVGHFLAPVVLGVPFSSPTSVVPLLGYIAAATAFAFVWSRFFRRGPLEQVLHTATRPAALVR